MGLRRSPRLCVRKYPDGSEKVSRSAAENAAGRRSGSRSGRGRRPDHDTHVIAGVVANTGGVIGGDDFPVGPLDTAGITAIARREGIGEPDGGAPRLAFVRAEFAEYATLVRNAGAVGEKQPSISQAGEVGGNLLGLAHVFGACPRCAVVVRAEQVDLLRTDGPGGGEPAFPLQVQERGFVVAGADDRDDAPGPAIVVAAEMPGAILFFRIVSFLGIGRGVQRPVCASLNIAKDKERTETFRGRGKRVGVSPSAPAITGTADPRWQKSVAERQFFGLAGLLEIREAGAEHDQVAIFGQPGRHVHAVGVRFMGSDHAALLPKAAILARPRLDRAGLLTVAGAVEDGYDDRAIGQDREIGPGADVIDADVTFDGAGESGLRPRVYRGKQGG